MLAEFSYLGSAKAEEVVITNTNLIADQIESMAPVRPDKCPPVIEDSDEQLRTICYNRAHEMYGENLPQIVIDRLERELNSIISNDFFAGIRLNIFAIDHCKRKEIDFSCFGFSFNCIM